MSAMQCCRLLPLSIFPTPGHVFARLFYVACPASECHILRHAHRRLLTDLAVVSPSARARHLALFLFSWRGGLHYTWVHNFRVDPNRSTQPF